MSKDPYYLLSFVADPDAESPEELVPRLEELNQVANNLFCKSSVCSGPHQLELEKLKQWRLEIDRWITRLEVIIDAWP